MKSKLLTLKNNPELLCSLLCGVFLFSGMLLEWLTSLSHNTLVVIYLLSYLTGGYFKAKEGILDSIENKDLNVDLLMMIAAIGAATIGYWEEGAMLIFIFAISGALESYTFNKSHQEIAALLELQPDEALRLNPDGSEEVVATATLQVGDRILIKPGERVPSDGQITLGETNLDEAAITGESLPVEKGVGDDIFASTVNLRGSIQVHITKLATETLFAKIIALVQNAQSEKSRAQLFIEKWEGLYVKVVLALVLATGALGYFAMGLGLNVAVRQAIILLIVASPCALVASITPATLAAISHGAKSGILFKGGVQLEKLATLQAIAFDKTGTLTQGKPVVTDIYTNGHLSEAALLHITATLERHSTHPLADAIIQHAKQSHNLTPANVDSVQNVVGFGIEGAIQGIAYKVGKAEFFTGNPMDFHNGVPKQLQAAAKTLVFVGDSHDTLLGVIALKDTIRPEAKAAIAALHQAGIQTIMITGDNEATAKIIANEVGLSAYHAGQLPDGKVTLIKALKETYTTVAMIGDGINDAPALATADIGIAMGEGTDVALETADVVLMKNNLTRIAQAVTLSQRLKVVTRQNIAFALLIISALIVWNFVGTVPIPLAVLGHEGSTILVILNGLRLLKSKE